MHQKPPPPPSRRSRENPIRKSHLDSTRTRDLMHRNPSSILDSSTPSNVTNSGKAQGPSRRQHVHHTFPLHKYRAESPAHTPGTYSWYQHASGAYTPDTPSGHVGRGWGTWNHPSRCCRAGRLNPLPYFLLETACSRQSTAFHWHGTASSWCGIVQTRTESDAVDHEVQFMSTLPCNSDFRIQNLLIVMAALMMAERNSFRGLGE